MKTYNAVTGEEIESPDLEAGYTYPGKRYIGTQKVVMQGSVERYPPDGLRHEEPVYEDCLFWQPNPTEPPEQQEPDIDKKISDAVTAAVALAQGGM